MNDYPRMLYRKGDADSPLLHGLNCETMTVDSAENEQRLSKSEGWRRTPAEAHGKKSDLPASAISGGSGLQADSDVLLREVEDLRAQLDKALARAEAAEKERDESRELIAAFDHDQDGKPGGSKPKAEKA